jgi:hypothetical protein
MSISYTLLRGLMKKRQLFQRMRLRQRLQKLPKKKMTFFLGL